MKCISDQTDQGFFRTKMKKDDGLTVNKFYSVMLFSNAKDKYTSTNPEFLIFNDNGKWKTYPVDNFEPA